MKMRWKKVPLYNYYKTFLMLLCLLSCTLTHLSTNESTLSIIPNVLSTYIPICPYYMILSVHNLIAANVNFLRHIMTTLSLSYYYFALNRKSFWQRFLRRNKRWKIRVRQAVKHQAFYWTVLVCVFLNTVITALQYYNQPKWLTQFQGNGLK